MLNRWAKHCRHPPQNELVDVQTTEKPHTIKSNVSEDNNSRYREDGPTSFSEKKKKKTKQTNRI